MHIVIIGAGPAGLTAALKLAQNNQDNRYKITLLEGSQAIGGISQTVKHNGHKMDIGGHRFFTKDEEILQLWQELFPLQGKDAYDDKKLGRKKPLTTGGPDPETSDRVMLIRERVSRIYYKKHFFDYPISMKPETIINMGLITTIKAGLSYIKSAVFKRPDDSLENFYINRFGKALYQIFFAEYTEKLWGRHPRDISADWGAQRVKGLSIISMLKNMLIPKALINKKEVETSLIEEFWYPKYGPGQLWEAVAEDISHMGVNILKGYEVKEIACEDGEITSVTCTTEHGIESIDADIFISSMPLKDLVCGMTGAGKPTPEVVEIAQGLPYRDFITVGLLVDKLNLKNTTHIKTLGDTVPDCWIYIQDGGVKLGRLQVFNNWSPYLVKDPEHSVWIGLEYFCNEGDTLWSMGESEFIDFAIKELQSMGIIEHDAVKDSHCQKVKKAYPAYFDTYAQIDTLIESINTYQNLYCIGRNGQHRYNNMDHSMLTAIEAAKCIINNGADKSRIWDINTEQEYHESRE